MIGDLPTAYLPLRNRTAVRQPCRLAVSIRCNYFGKHLHECVFPAKKLGASRHGGWTADCTFGRHGFTCNSASTAEAEMSTHAVQVRERSLFRSFSQVARRQALSGGNRVL